MKQEFSGGIGGGGVASAIPSLEKPPVVDPSSPDKLDTPADALAADLAQIDGGRQVAPEAPAAATGEQLAETGSKPAAAEAIPVSAPETKPAAEAEPVKPGTRGFWDKLKYRWQALREGRASKHVASQLEKVAQRQAAAQAEAEAHEKTVAEKQAALAKLQKEMTDLGLSLPEEAVANIQEEMNQYAGLAGEAGRRANELGEETRKLRASFEGQQLKRREMVRAFNEPLIRKQEANTLELTTLTEAKRRLEEKRKEIEKTLAKLEAARQQVRTQLPGKKGAIKEALVLAEKQILKKAQETLASLGEVNGELEKVVRKVAQLEDDNQDLERQKVSLEETKAPSREAVPAPAPSETQLVQPAETTVAAAMAETPVASAPTPVAETAAVPSTGGQAETVAVKPTKGVTGRVADSVLGAAALRRRSGVSME